MCFEDLFALYKTWVTTYVIIQTYQSPDNNVFFQIVFFIVSLRFVLFLKYLIVELQASFSLRLF